MAEEDARNETNPYIAKIDIHAIKEKKSIHRFETEIEYEKFSTTGEDVENAESKQKKNSKILDNITESKKKAGKSKNSGDELFNQHYHDIIANQMNQNSRKKLNINPYHADNIQKVRSIMLLHHDNIVPLYHNFFLTFLFYFM